MTHQAVLLDEVIKYLNPKTNQNFIDCTFGAGGHSYAILNKTEPFGKILAIDADAQCEADIKYKTRIKLIHDNFKNLKYIYEHFFPYSINGILCDLGLSSMELELRGRGFSFMRDEPLDMRYDTENQNLTAGFILNRYAPKRINLIFRELGEIPVESSKRVTDEIVQERRKKKFETTFDLVKLIYRVLRVSRFAKEKIGKRKVDAFRRNRRAIHPATLFFQALRIEVNKELDNLVSFLPVAVAILPSGARLAIISFHSLEDRIVKHYFRDISRGEDKQVKIITKKPICASEREIAVNPRSRSAKLRIIEKI